MNAVALTAKSDSEADSSRQPRLNPAPDEAPGGEVQILNPLEYPHWDARLEARRDSSIFHGSEWARVLRESYGHRPFYFCRTAKDRIIELLPVMEVCSALTGRRGVALPFTDYCGSLRGTERETSSLHAAAMALGRARGWRYLECRCEDGNWAGSSPSLEFYGHVVDLSGDSDALFKRLESSVRRGIRKAEQNELEISFTRDAEGMATYYKLHCETRRRHGVPPQPARFFDNIARYIMGKNHGFIAIASHEAKPVAAAVFFHFCQEAVYKFGASHQNFQHLRPNNLVMWEAMKRLAGEGFSVLHLGRTSLTNSGLRRFKLGFGAREEKIRYTRFDFRKEAFVTCVDRAETWANHLFRLFPAPLFRLTGRLLYPHLC